MPITLVSIVLQIYPSLLPELSGVCNGNDARSYRLGPPAKFQSPSPVAPVVFGSRAAMPNVVPGLPGTFHCVRRAVFFSECLGAMSDAIKTSMCPVARLFDDSGRTIYSIASDTTESPAFSSVKTCYAWSVSKRILVRVHIQTSGSLSCNAYRRRTCRDMPSVHPLQN